MQPSTQSTEETSASSHLSLHSIESSINELKKENSVHSWLPKFFNGLIRRQGVVNKFIISVLEKLFGEFSQLNESTSQLQRDLGVLEKKLRREFQQDIARLKNNLSSELQKRTEALQANLEIERQQREQDKKFIHSHLGALLSSSCVFDKQINQITESLDNLQKDLSKDRLISTTQFGKKQKIIDDLKQKENLLEKNFNLYINETRPIFKKLGQNILGLEKNHTQTLGKLAALRKEADSFRAALEHQLKLQKIAKQFGDKLENAQESLAKAVSKKSIEFETLVNVFKTQLEDIEKRAEEFETRANEFNNQARDIKTQTAKIEIRIVDQDELLRKIKDEDIYNMSLNLQSINQHLEQENHNNRIQQDHEVTLKKAIDPFYKSFEEKYRGPREDIIQRFSQYQEIIEKASKVREKRRLPKAIDLGCGRGEWLELLNENKFSARGVDTNEIFVSECNLYGLNVDLHDALETLIDTPTNSTSIVSAFHLVEHVSFGYLIQLFQETHRVLLPGGALLFETPNPENLIVSTQTFYLDPTHRNPLPPNLLSFCANYVGFSKIKVHASSSYPVEARIPGRGATNQKLNELLFGPQDYAIIAYK